MNAKISVRAEMAMPGAPKVNLGRTIVTSGIGHAYARLFGTGSALSGNTVKLYTKSHGSFTAAELAGLDDGYPKKGGGGVQYRSTFVPQADYTLGALQLRVGSTVAWETSNAAGVWSPSPGLPKLIAANRYEITWTVLGHVELLIPDTLPRFDNFDQKKGRTGFEAALTASSIQTGEKWLVERWSGVDTSPRGAFQIELYGPDLTWTKGSDTQHQLPPFEALQAGHTVLREGPYTATATVGDTNAEGVKLAFNLPAKTDESGAAAYRYGVVKAGGRIIGLSDLGPIYPFNAIRYVGRGQGGDPSALVAKLYNQAA